MIGAGADGMEGDDDAAATLAFARTDVNFGAMVLYRSRNAFFSFFSCDCCPPESPIRSG
jgi:hypothetical protein